MHQTDQLSSAWPFSCALSIEFHGSELGCYYLNVQIFLAELL